MLTVTDKELVAAAVDGELTDGTEFAFRQLLADSADARTLFQRLLADRDALRLLPRLVAPANTADLVVRRVDRLPRAFTATADRGVQRWAGYAVAASLFLAVGAVSFWAARPTQEQVVRPGQGGTPARPSGSLLAKANGGGGLELLPTPRPADNPSLAQSVPVQSDRQLTAELAPTPRPARLGEALASGPLTGVDLKRDVGGRLPLLVTFGQFDQPDTRQRLTDELTRDGASRLDLFCPDLYRAIEYFQTSARATGLRVVADAAGQELAGKRLVTAFALYTESLNAAEIADLFAAAARHSREAGGRSFGTGHVYPAGATEQRDLRDLLGIDPGLWKRAKPAPVGPKSLAAGTVDQLTTRLDKGGKSALLLTYLPVAGRTLPGASKEVRAFLDQREDRKPGAVPLLIVFRQEN